jgi:hypothetical protein
MVLKRKHPNALKHGAFADTAFLPGESREEFEDLHSALAAEWMPDGPTECDAVLSIARGLWRKRRVQRYLEAEVLSAGCHPNHIAYDEVSGLQDLAAVLQDGSEDTFDKEAPHSITSEQIKYLREKVPRGNFKSTSEWTLALVNEINSVLVPHLLKLYRHMGHSRLTLQSTAILSRELFKEELALEERIDAMIDRATKRLMQTKMMKQMLGHSRPKEDTDDSKKIQVGQLNGAQL